MKAIMYGGGNIGRGFIGPLFRNAGYEVVFIDVQTELIEALNERRTYPLRIISDAGHEDIIIDGISAIDGKDAEAVSDAIASADICATAVGAGILDKIAPNVALGIKKRLANSDKPLNIIICENLMDADKIFTEMVRKDFSEEEQRRCSEQIGFVEASIGRMVPVQTDEMKDGDPLRVCVERYGSLPVDKDAFKGAIPEIANMYPFSPFGFYIERKLYVHNLGHAVCAYLGMLSGYEYIYEAVSDIEIRFVAQNAMLEAVAALSIKYGVELAGLMPHVNDLILRFKNRALKDTCARVGGDPVRKLARKDRLIGPAFLCEGQGVTSDYISIGIAAGLFQFLKENGREQNQANAVAALHELAGVKPGDSFTEAVLENYKCILDGGKACELIRLVDERRARRTEDIV